MDDNECPCCIARKQADIRAREWERQAKQWEGGCKLLRTKLDAALAELAAARTLIADLESRLGEAQQGLYVMEEKNSS